MEDDNKFIKRLISPSRCKGSGSGSPITLAPETDSKRRGKSIEELSTSENVLVQRYFRYCSKYLASKMVVTQFQPHFDQVYEANLMKMLTGRRLSISIYYRMHIYNL